MPLIEKIIITFIVVIGVFLLLKIMRLVNNQLKANLLKSNPKLVDNAG